MQKEIDKLEFVQGVNFDFEFTDSLKNNGTKFFISIEISCGDICSSRAVVDVAFAGRQRRVTFVYIKHNCFITATMGKTLSYKMRTFFSSDLHVTWGKSTTLVPIWELHQS